MEKMFIAATGLSPNYLPEYLADAFGFFSDENIEFDTDVPEPWERVLDEVDAGRAQAALGGIWVPAMYRDIRSYRVFALLSNRSPVSVVTRNRVEEFDWSTFDDKVVFVAGGGHASTYLYLRGVLEELGAPCRGTRFVHDLSDAVFGELFSNGLGDIFVTDDLTAAVAESNGQGFVSARLSELTGRMPWSVYYCRADDPPSEYLLARFVAAVDRARAWLADHSAREAQEVVARLWPDVDIDVSLDVLERMRACGMWDSVLVDEGAWQRWEGMLVRAGLLPSSVPFRDLVKPPAGSDR